MPDENQGPTGKDVARMLGVPYRTLMSWIGLKLIHPPGYIGRQGHTVLWPDRCVREARTVAELRRQGCSMQMIRDVAAYLRELGFNPYSKGRHLVVETSRRGRPKRLIRVCDDGKALELLRRGRGQLQLFVLPETETPNPRSAGR